MKLLHGTEKNSAKKILKSKNINPSVFDLRGYLEGMIKKTNSFTELPKELDGIHAMWLGEGVYAFDETDYELAKTWKTRYPPKVSEQNCRVLALSLNIDAKKHVLNLSSKPGKVLLQKYLVTGLGKFIEKEYPKHPKNKDLYSFILAVGRRCLIDNTSKEPHAIGFFIELMIKDGIINIEQTPVVKATFKKESYHEVYYETYFCIKNRNIITNLEAI